MLKTLTVATRKSNLALWQAKYFASAVHKMYPNCTIHFLALQTQGDKNLSASLVDEGGKALFLKELQSALLEGSADIAVHSMKDVPSTPTPQLQVQPVFERDRADDVLITRKGLSFDQLASNTVIGTASIRRTSQILSVRPDLCLRPLRGNINTRLQSLQDDKFGAIVLAAAGIARLQTATHLGQKLIHPHFVPAPTQGVLAVEYLADNLSMRSLANRLQHRETNISTQCERHLSLLLNGSCKTPLGALCTVHKQQLQLNCYVGTKDGSISICQQFLGSANNPLQLAEQAAQKMLHLGAKKIIALYQ